MASPIDTLRELVKRATPGDWEIQDGCSWRRIGTQEGNGNVLCPYNSRADNHPDLCAARGEDIYANLRLIIAAVNLAKAITSDEAVETMALAIQNADTVGAKCVGAADGLSEDVSDWGAYLARAALSAILSTGVVGDG